MRLNLALLVVLALCAVAVVSAQHSTRRIFSQYEQERAREKQLNVEYDQLQLEQSTWAMHARIEKVALAQLKMQMPPQARVQVVERDPAAAKAAGAAVTGPANPAGPRAPGAALPAVSGKPAVAPQ